MPPSHYAEGDWIWIPINHAGRGVVGRIARIAPTGAIFLVYALGPVREELPSHEALKDLAAHDAVVIGMCGDLGILNGDWQVVRNAEPFDRAAWPMAIFGDWTDPSSPGRRIEYKAGLPNTEPTVTAISFDEARWLPRDGVHGYKAFEKVLRHTFGVRLEESPPNEAGRMRADHYVYFSSKRIANSAAQQMLKAVPGANVAVRQSADKWLAQLSHELLRDVSMEVVTDRLTRIAFQRGGEYDGWEKDV